MDHSLVGGLVAAAVDNPAGIPLPVQLLLEDALNRVLVLDKAAENEAGAEAPAAEVKAPGAIAVRIDLAKTMIRPPARQRKP